MYISRRVDKRRSVWDQISGESSHRFFLLMTSSSFSPRFLIPSASFPLVYPSIHLFLSLPGVVVTLLPIILPSLAITSVQKAFSNQMSTSISLKSVFDIGFVAGFSWGVLENRYEQSKSSSLTATWQLLDRDASGHVNKYIYYAIVTACRGYQSVEYIHIYVHHTSHQNKPMTISGMNANSPNLMLHAGSKRSKCGQSLHSAKSSLVRFLKKSSKNSSL